jgi:YbbR domain-containing protein
MSGIGARISAFWRAALFDNVGLKVVSMICALAIYAFIHGAETVQRTFSVGVVSVMPPDAANRQLRTPLPTEVAVTVRGPRTELDRMTPGDLGSIKLDLRTGQETKIELDHHALDVPAGVKIEQVFPASVNIRWDDVVNTSIKVQVTRTGDAEPGFMVQATLVEPEAVYVRGPKSVVDVMQSVRTVPFDVSGLGEGTHKRTLALDVPPDGIVYDRDEVTAAVEVAREERTASFAAVNVEVLGVPKAKVQPPVVNIKVRGPAELVRSLERVSVVPRVEVPEADRAKPGSHLAQVIVDLPGLDVTIEPETVLVKW